MENVIVVRRTGAEVKMEPGRFFKFLLLLFFLVKKINSGFQHTKIKEISGTTKVPQRKGHIVPLSGLILRTPSFICTLQVLNVLFS